MSQQHGVLRVLTPSASGPADVTPWASGCPPAKRASSSAAERPSLTTVSIRPREQGRELGRLLLGRLDGTLGDKPQAVLFEPEIVARKSA